MSTSLLSLAPPDAEWMGQGRCQGFWQVTDVEERGPTVEVANRRAKELCAECPVWRQCREWALTRRPDDVFGVVGGLTVRERREVQKRRSRAA